MTTGRDLGDVTCTMVGTCRGRARRCLNATIVALMVCGSSMAAFQSAVITLNFPLSVRSLAMGEAGCALADDEGAAFYNPAGLGVPNPRWRGGAVMGSGEYLLPALRLPDLYHIHAVGAYQPPVPTRLGGFAIDLNYISFGTNEATNEDGVVTDRFYSWEGVATLAWGFNLREFGFDKHNFGIGIKYLHSSLAPQKDGTGVAQSWALDLGYLYKLRRTLSIGAALANIGPAVFYVSRADADPIPFLVRLGVAYRPFQNAHSDLVMTTDIYREFAGKEYGTPVHNSFDGAYFDLKRGKGEKLGNHLTEEFRETQLNTGVEYWCWNLGALRTGFLYDYVGERYELTWGWGLNLFDHFSLDWSVIHSPEGFMGPLLRRFFTDRGDSHREGSHGVRDGQVRFSLTCTRLARWSPSDGQWFLRPRRP